MAHNDTVFAQVLKLVPRHEFESLARKHKSGRMSRSMTRWGQFVAMGMAQLTGRCSLRDIVSNLAAQSCKLYHLGVGVVTRSSLARVNAEKPWEMYEELHGRLLGRCQAKAPGHGYRFKAKLFSVDSTTIDLCLSAFPWAKFRRTKGAVKVHVGLDHEGYLPTFVRVTNGKTSDIEAARALTLPKGSIVAADRAYVDFAWIDSLISEGIHLVTRLKRGIKYGVVETREVNAKRGVTSDETIEFTSAKGRKQCPHRLRRIGYHDRKTGKDYVFLTTHFHLSAKTIADIYKSRWQVELFFKWIKQNLKVKSFVGTSRNAVMTQVWTAMCIYLILSYIKFANRIAWRLSEILRLLQLNLFERRPASGVAGKRKRESTGSFIPVDDEVHVDLVGQQWCGPDQPKNAARGVLDLVCSTAANDPAKHLAPPCTLPNDFARLVSWSWAGRREPPSAPCVLSTWGGHVPRRSATLVYQLRVPDRVALLDPGVGQLVEQHVHLADGPGAEVLLLAVERQVARIAPVPLDVMGALDQHAAGTGGPVADGASVRSARVARR